MLGRTIAESDGIEGAAATVSGLGDLPVETVLGTEKTLKQVSGTSIADGNAFWGYEMHVGITAGASIPLPRMSDGREDGAISADGRLAGCYIHGFFHSTAPRPAWLARLGTASNGLANDQTIDAPLAGRAEEPDTGIHAGAPPALT